MIPNDKDACLLHYVPMGEIQPEVQVLLGAAVRVSLAASRDLSVGDMLASTPVCLREFADEIERLLAQRDMNSSAVLRQSLAAMAAALNCALAMTAGVVCDQPRSNPGLN